MGWGNHWNMYGFDERFLKHVLYFEALAKDQMVTICYPGALVRNGFEVDWLRERYPANPIVTMG